jgi:hypothetical protein
MTRAGILPKGCRRRWSGPWGWGVSETVNYERQGAVAQVGGECYLQGNLRIQYYELVVSESGIE